MPRKSPCYFKTPSFVEACRAVHGDKYDYTTTVFTKMRDPIMFGCSVHGEVSISRAETHLHGGKGCPQCSHDARSERLLAVARSVWPRDFWDRADEERAAVLRTVLHYHEDTGVLEWRRSACPSVLVGDTADNVNEQGYRLIGIANRVRSQHRVIWLMKTGREPEQIDHINGDRGDNRWDNLRNVDALINAQNRRVPQTDNTSGFLGVVYANGYAKPWKAQLSTRGRCYTSYHTTPEEAHEAYVALKRTWHEGNTL